MARRFEILEANTRQYRRHNAVERQLTVRLILPSGSTNSVAYFLASANELIKHALRDVNESDMLGMTIQNQVKQNDKPIGNSFRR